jgi:hypothetical protein
MASVVAIDGSIPCAACSQSNPRDPDDEVRRVADFIVTANMSSIVGGTMHSAKDAWSFISLSVIDLLCCYPTRRRAQPCIDFAL